MIGRSRRIGSFAVLAGLAASLLTGCVGAGGYGDDGFGTNYYGVYGADFGGWGDGFGVGPYHDDRLLSGTRGRYHFRGARGDHIPSIAGHARGRFGGRGGGFGGRGGGFVGHDGGHGGGGHGK